MVCVRLSGEGPSLRADSVNAGLGEGREEWARQPRLGLFLVWLLQGQTNRNLCCSAIRGEARAGGMGRRRGILLEGWSDARVSKMDVHPTVILGKEEGRG